MEAVRALADLVEISPQIEVAAVLTGRGELEGSVGVSDAGSQLLASSVRRLLDGAAAHRRDNGRLTQLHAELADGDLFAVTGPEERTIVAVTAGRVSPGLLFHDLKRCLAVISAGSTGGEAAAARRQDRPAERGPGADET